MRIGELAAASSTPTVTIRFYEQIGLLSLAGRTPGRFRVYGPAHLERLVFIRNCRSLDMPIEDIRALLLLKDGSKEGIEEATAALDRHQVRIAQRIDELRHLEQQLDSLRQSVQALKTST